MRHFTLSLLPLVVAALLLTAGKSAAASLSLAAGDTTFITVDINTGGADIDSFDFSIDFSGTGTSGLDVTSLSLGTMVPASSVASFFAMDQGTGFFGPLPPPAVGDVSTLTLPFDVIGSLAGSAFITGTCQLFSIGLKTSTAVA